METGAASAIVVIAHVVEQRAPSKRAQTPERLNELSGKEGSSGWVWPGQPAVATRR